MKRVEKNLSLLYDCNCARVAELVDAIDLGSIVLGRASSILASSTTYGLVAQLDRASPF